MFIITLTALCNLFYFLTIFYLLFVFCAVFYLFFSLPTYFGFTKFSKTSFQLFNGIDFLPILFVFIFLNFFLNYSWTSYSVYSWFGHLIFTNVQKNFFFLSLFILTLIFTAHLTSFYIISHELFDYLITVLNFHVWTTFLFYANSFFSVVFFLEILSTLIFLLVVSATFSSTYFYNNLNFNEHLYFTGTLSNTYLHSLMTFFWISLISSLNLFVSLIFFYCKFLSFDWYLLEITLFTYFLTDSALSIISFFMVWAFFFFFIFLKCGLVPFYFWKPVFFKGLTIYVLFFYIFYLYFLIFLFFTSFFLFYLTEMFSFFFFLFNLFLLCGLIILFFILCESFYLKSFLALSSILNTLFVFIALASTSLFYFI